MVSDNITEMVTALGNALRRKGWTVSSAESCTGGGVAFAFTSIAGSSDWFNQSWVTYSNDAKIRELAVKPETLNAHGAVSMQTVEEMAAGVKYKSDANVVVTVSGIAGPGGGSEEKPVGTVWFGFICGAKSETIKQVFAGDRETVRLHAIEFAITHLLAMLAD